MAQQWWQAAMHVFHPSHALSPREAERLLDEALYDAYRGE